MADVSMTVIGGGVIGLAVAAELARDMSPLVVLERRARHGQETSSRNSEVIHAGIYYPAGSLKARLCVDGNRLLYDICAKHDIPHRRITKIITATSTAELEDLQTIFALGQANGADLQMLSARQVRDLEPDIQTAGGIFSPWTGIISAHGLMDHFYHAVREQGADMQMNCTVVGIERRPGAYLLTIEEGGSRSTFTSECVVNAAGLESDTMAGLAGIDLDAAGYRLHWCKGSYFALPASLSKSITRLVYPVPAADSLGVHAVIDLGGRLRFGPDVEYLDERKEEYAVAESKRHAFAESIRKILPHVKDEDLTPDISGIRAKLQRKGGPPRDFIIGEESGRGLPGFVNLIGIDSPGLTASPAIARYVRSLLRS